MVQLDDRLVQFRQVQGKRLRHFDLVDFVSQVLERLWHFVYVETLPVHPRKLVECLLHLLDLFFCQLVLLGYFFFLLFLSFLSFLLFTWFISVVWFLDFFVHNLRFLFFPRRDFCLNFFHFDNRRIILIIAKQIAEPNIFILIVSFFLFLGWLLVLGVVSFSVEGQFGSIAGVTRDRVEAEREF